MYLSGSKKHNLNHLLNFNYAPHASNNSASDGNHQFQRGIYGRKQHARYNKEQFLQAICQFVVRADIDWKPYTQTADQLVEWSSIEQVHVQSSEEPQCPICLYHPVAGKMTRCGHVYCWPCVLHYLALSDKTWRKCPICFEAIHAADLKRLVTNSNILFIFTIIYMKIAQCGVEIVLKLQSGRHRKSSVDVPPKEFATDFQDEWLFVGC